MLFFYEFITYFERILLMKPLIFNNVYLPEINMADKHYVFYNFILNVHVCVLPYDYGDVNVFYHHENAYDRTFLYMNKLQQ